MKYLCAFAGAVMGLFASACVGFVISIGRSFGSWGMALTFAIIGAIIGFLLGRYVDEKNEKFRTHDANDVKYWGNMNPKYSASIRCKYCCHFEPKRNVCHLYQDFDQSIDAGGGAYYKTTSPDSRCSKFSVTAMDAMAQDLCKKRPDGSYIVGLDDVFR